MTDYTFAAQFRDKTTGEGKNGITVTVDVGRTGVSGAVASGLSATDLGFGGFFILTYSAAVDGNWFANFKTTDTTVEAKHLGSWAAVEIPRIDAAVSSRLAAAGYTAPDNAGVTAIKAKTDNLPSSPASSSEVAAVAASVWDRLTSALSQNNSIGKALAGLLAVFNGSTRTLTMTPSQIEALAEGELEIIRGDIYTHEFTDLGNLTGRTALIFTLKNNLNADDSKATIQVEEGDDPGRGRRGRVGAPERGSRHSGVCQSGRDRRRSWPCPADHPADGSRGIGAGPQCVLRCPGNARRRPYPGNGHRADCGRRYPESRVMVEELRAWLRLIWHLPLLIGVACLGAYLGWLERQSGRWLDAEYRARTQKTQGGK